MPKILLRDFDIESRQFRNFDEINVLQVPTSGDKITYEINGVTYIYEVYDVHYADNNHVDVNIILISDVTTYYGSGFFDIPYP